MHNTPFQSEYGDSKLYPIFPRYTMLKDMIKDIMHNPDYMEVCHEVDNWNKILQHSHHRHHHRRLILLNECMKFLLSNFWIIENCFHALGTLFTFFYYENLIFDNIWLGRKWKVIPDCYECAETDAVRIVTDCSWIEMRIYLNWTATFCKL